MSAPKDRFVFRYVPAPYRRAADGAPLSALTGMLERALRALDRRAEQVLMGAYLDQAPDLEDTTALAELYQTTPWPGEALTDFKYRVKELARVHLEGPATATTFLRVVALALNAILDGPPFSPGEQPPGREANDRYTTAARLTRRADKTRSYWAAVVDAPRVPANQTIQLNEQACWQVSNSLFSQFPFTGTDAVLTQAVYPDPVIDIKAGGQALVAPVLCQLDLHRFVLINRVIPPGATLRVDLSGETHSVTSMLGLACTPGPVVVNGAFPDLLYGAGSQVGEPLGDNLRLVAWHPEWVAAPPPLPLPEPEPGGPIPWTSLLGLGPSRWQLLSACTQEGRPPAAAEEIPLEQLRALPVQPDRVPQMAFLWSGRQPGTFTVQYGEELTGKPPADAGPRQHTWLERQIDWLKQAGVIYLTTGQLAEKQVWLQDQAAPAEQLITHVEPHRRSRLTRDAVYTADAVTLSINEEE